MRQGRFATRFAPLLAAGFVVLHELNRTAGGAPLTGHGHSYLPLAIALVTVLMALTCISFMHELCRASRGQVQQEDRVPFRAHWAFATAALFVTFVIQEWIEAWTTPGHPAGVSHAIAHITWATPALAIALGALITLLLRGSRSAIALIARRHERSAPQAERGRWGPLPPAQAPSVAVLAANRAGRAPPATFFT